MLRNIRYLLQANICILILREQASDVANLYQHLKNPFKKGCFKRIWSTPSGEG